MRLLSYDDSSDCSIAAANVIREAITGHNEKRPFVLGLPTGSTPIGTYIELVRLHRTGQLSFKNVITFNMDEYVGISRSDSNSYWKFMHDNLFDHIDIPRENINILDGNAKDLQVECANYESKIKSVGGIDLFFGGVGNDGHIAFNEPGSSLASRTREIMLTPDTIEANSRFFQDDIGDVPNSAVTIGVGTFMESRSVLVIATGEKKARAIEAAVEGPINFMWTISCLQMHPNATLVIDHAASGGLKLRTYEYFRNMYNSQLNNLAVKRTPDSA